MQSSVCVSGGGAFRRRSPDLRQVIDCGPNSTRFLPALLVPIVAPSNLTSFYTDTWQHRRLAAAPPFGGSDHSSSSNQTMASRAATVGDPRRPQEVKKVGGVVLPSADDSLSFTLLMSGMFMGAFALLFQVSLVRSFSEQPHTAVGRPTILTTFVAAAVQAPHMGRCVHDTGRIHAHAVRHAKRDAAAGHGADVSDATGCVHAACMLCSPQLRTRSCH